MKKELKLFKSWYGKFTVKQLIPKFRFSKNVQGWFFTRNWSVTLFTYCLNYSITITSDTNEEHNIAHEKNVALYML
jgi:hypothetical protein